jgi:hypothetical protein
MKKTVWVRSAIVWISIVVVPCLALFEQPESGSLGAWLWDDLDDLGADAATGSLGDDVMVQPARVAEGAEGRGAVEVGHAPIPTPTFSRHPLSEPAAVGTSEPRQIALADDPGPRREYPRDMAAPIANSNAELGTPDPLPPVHSEVSANAELLEITQRLRSLGATYYVLECWGQPIPWYRFRCKVAMRNAAAGVTTYESTQRNPAAAAREVLEQLAQRERLSRN